SADVDLALRAVAFAAMGTAGQRCTTLRRLFVQDTIHDAFLARLSRVYASVKIGDPRAPDTLVGPLIDGRAFALMKAALDEARATWPRPSASSPRRDPTAALPTSTSALRAQRSGAPSAARRRLAEVARPARTRGRPICGAPPTRSTTAPNCRLPRACASTLVRAVMAGP